MLRAPLLVRDSTADLQALYREPDNRIDISIPEYRVKQQPDSRAHTEYLVVTCTTLPYFSKKVGAVWRRYSAFEDLARGLDEGWVPELPAKTFFPGENRSKSFIESRRVDLQSFIQRVADDPRCRDGHALVMVNAFLFEA